MIHNPENTDNLKMSVFLKDGTSFLHKDITRTPFGEHERQVSFWLDQETVRSYPMGEVAYIELHCGG